MKFIRHRRRLRPAPNGHIDLEQDGRERTRGRHWRWPWILLLVAVAGLIALRLALPTLVRNFVNRTLAEHPEYTGNVADVDIHLWRGAYSIHDVVVRRREGDPEHPLFTVSRVDLSVDWKELVRGKIVSDIDVFRPQVHFIAGPTPEQSQTGADRDWGEALDKLAPFRIDRFDVHEGRVRFIDPTRTPRVDLLARDITATATNLTNSREVSDPLPASVIGRAVTTGDGLLELDVRLDPMARHPTFEVIAQLTNLNLTALNDFMQAYGEFDVEKGTFHLYTSVAGREGQYEGYLKVLFENLDILQWKKDQREDGLGVFWEAIVGTVTTLLKNQPKDRLATRIPIAGSYEGTDVGIWSALSTLLRNAFIRALVPKLDERVNLEEVDGRREDAESAKARGGETDSERTRDSNRDASEDRRASVMEPEDTRTEPAKGAQMLLRHVSPGKESSRKEEDNPAVQDEGPTDGPSTNRESSPPPRAVPPPD